MSSISNFLSKDFESEVDRKTCDSETTSFSVSGSGKVPAYTEDEQSASDTVIHVKHTANPKEKVVCGIDNFYYVADSLALRRNIDRRLDLEEMANVNYVCAGSNSHIFSATWSNKNVIVKTLKQSKIRCNIAISELNMEAELLTRIDHPNIIKILGAGVFPKQFIVLERVQDVARLVNFDRPAMFRRKPFNFPQFLKIAKDFADAMLYLHDQVSDDAMLIHRDLKPENLGLTSDGHLKLFDFGLCRCVRKRTKDDQVYEMTGNTGSLRYMAPEVVLGEPYNEKVDVFSFAVVIWAISRNQEPFAGFDIEAHRRRVVINGERPLLKKTWPVEFKELLSDCWHADSAKRPNFQQVSDRLSSIISNNDNLEKRSTLNSIFRNISMASFKGSR